MQRRQLLVRSLLLVLLTGSRAEAQPRIYRLAYLNSGEERNTLRGWNTLAERLEALGYREGRNLVVERRHADGQLERLPALAAELVAHKPDLILTSASFAALAASKATSTIPIVFTFVGDPVGMGIVKSLGRPGTNATGLSGQSLELIAKRLQLLKEVAPSISRVAVLHDPLNAISVTTLARLRETSKALGLVLRAVEQKSSQEFSAALKALEAERPDALYVIETPLAGTQIERIVEFANGLRVPAIYGETRYAEAGGLMSFSWNSIEQWQRAATYIDRILRGTKPADLPVELPLQFEVVLNLKTAKALGVRFPQTVLLRASRVIE